MTQLSITWDLRADENRKGYISHKPNITPAYPFQDDGLVLADIKEILMNSGVGMPPYTNWGRTRSGCFFCFYQQKIEWVRLKETHPDLFEEAKKYEHCYEGNGNVFTWSERESLEELEKPERMEEIKRDYELRKVRKLENRENLTLAQVFGDDTIEDEEPGCLICSL